MTTHVGTGLFCLVRFINLFLREVFFRAAICDFRINFLWFLSVGLHAGMHARVTVLYADMNQMTRAVSISLKHQYPSLSASGAAFSVSMTAD
jgi:hypothetical protein